MATSTDHFFVFALPRSRTAWIANWLTHGDVVCLHDAMRTSPSPPSLEMPLMRHRVRGVPYVGTSDNGAVLWIDEVLAEYPSAPVAIVERDPGDVLDSLISYHPDLDTEFLEVLVETSARRLRAAKDEHDVLAVPFEGLADISVLETLHRHLLPEVEFNRNRAELMQSFNVQLQPDVYLEQMSPAFAEAIQSIQWEAV